MYKERIINIIKPMFVIISIGLIYAVFYALTDIGIPCFFNKITGLKCPGCGITHMCMNILKLDFYNAFKDNPAIFSLSPFWLIAFIYQIIHYIKTGDRKLVKPVNILIWISLIILIIWGVLRNITIL